METELVANRHAFQLSTEAKRQAFYLLTQPEEAAEEAKKNWLRWCLIWLLVGFYLILTPYQLCCFFLVIFGFDRLQLSLYLVVCSPR